ncbi:MAG TPA: IS110 family transposase [Chthoniobacterales bacterium]
MTKKARRSKSNIALPKINPHAAGIDIGANEIYVAVPADSDSDPVRCFTTFTDDLQSIVLWLASCGVKTVAMESTGVYWIPLFQILESAGFEVFLVNSRHVKNVPGRKTDVSDAQWLQYLHSVGLLRASFRPPQEVCALRHRDNLVQISSKHVLHMQKALTQMNVQIHNVITDITGVTGLRIIDEILAGTRDVQKLAALRDGRIKASAETIARSLVGDYRREHLFTLAQSLRHHKASVAEIAIHEHIYRITGIDLTRIPGIETQAARTLFCEIGPVIDRFATAKHFASWLGLCPDNRITGGRVLSANTRDVRSRAACILRMAANSLHRSQTRLGDFFRRMKGRLGTPKAITATAHKLARILFHLLRERVAYDDSIFAQQDQQHRQRKLKQIATQAAAYGFTLVASPQAQPSVS